MSNQIIVPSLGESVSEATVSKWLKQVGEKVDSDEPLVELETDKVNIEVPSPLTGTLSSIKVKEGDTVEVGALLGEVNEGKLTSNKPTETSSKEIDDSSYEPPKTIKKKNIKKENIKQNKKNIIKEQESLKLTEDTEKKNNQETLVLDTLADSDISKKEEQNYVPPKTKRNYA